jgi:hypothetical protein
VVEARAPLFEVVDPARLWVEALAYEADVAARLSDATAQTVMGETLPLRYLGGGRSLREHALPLQFAIAPRENGPAVSVGQPVKVYARLDGVIRAVPVPRRALVKGTDGSETVWVHPHAEQFTPRRVKTQPLDGDTVAVTEGLAAGERVVVQGAPLLSQIR